MSDVPIHPRHHAGISGVSFRIVMVMTIAHLSMRPVELFIRLLRIRRYGQHQVRDAPGKIQEEWAVLVFLHPPQSIGGKEIMGIIPLFLPRVVLRQVERLFVAPEMGRIVMVRVAMIAIAIEEIKTFIYNNSSKIKA